MLQPLSTLTDHKPVGDLLPTTQRKERLELTPTELGAAGAARRRRTKPPATPFRARRRCSPCSSCCAAGCRTRSVRALAAAAAASPSARAPTFSPRRHPTTTTSAGWLRIHSPGAIVATGQRPCCTCRRRGTGRTAARTCRLCPGLATKEQPLPHRQPTQSMTTVAAKGRVVPSNAAKPQRARLPPDRQRRQSRACSVGCRWHRSFGRATPPFTVRRRPRCCRRAGSSTRL